MIPSVDFSSFLCFLAYWIINSNKFFPNKVFLKYYIFSGMTYLWKTSSSPQMWKKTCQVIHYVIIRVSSKNIMVLLFCICVGMFETIIFIFCSTFMFLNLAWFVLDFSLIFYLPSKIIMFYQSLPLILHINPFTRFFYSSEMFSFLIVVVYSLSCVWLFVMLWTVACQDPLSMGFSRQEYWSGLLFPSPDLVIEPTSAKAGGFFTTEPLGKPFFPHTFDCIFHNNCFGFSRNVICL